LILDQDVYDALPPPEEEEEDMLDLAFELTDTSRLGCQIKVTKELDGMIARLPEGAP
jgi:ferredoxin